MFDSIQLIDGLHMYQDHNFYFPGLGGLRSIIFDGQTGEVHADREAPYTFEGSYTTSIKISISGRRVTVSRGNPSKIHRLDNLFGYETIDECVFVYNQILLSLDLPPFTKCTNTWQLVGEDGKKVYTVSDGAVITELHTTTNKSVGQGNVLDYLKGISTQRLRNSIPNLSANGCTVQWLSKKGHASLIHSSVYDKANEISLHQLPKIKRQYGESSPEYKKLLR